MSKLKRDILIVGLNQAYQKTLIFEELRKDEVNRARHVDTCVGGKGANFARAASTWDVMVEIYQFAGGHQGHEICRILNEEHIPHTTVFVDSTTRTCTTCLCQKTGTMTELIEPSGKIDPASRDTLLAHAKEAIRDFRGIALCGTFPPGVDASFYAAMAHEAKKNKVPVLLDAFRDISEVLQAGVDILKINTTELATISGAGTIRKGIDICLDKFDINTLAITDGAKQAYLANREGVWSYTLPTLPQVKNPLGAGDTVSAVFFGEYIKNGDLVKAFALGLAAGSESCLSFKCADFTKEDALKLSEKIEINKL